MFPQGCPRTRGRESILPPTSAQAGKQVPLTRTDTSGTLPVFPESRSLSCGERPRRNAGIFPHGGVGADFSSSAGNGALMRRDLCTRREMRKIWSLSCRVKDPAFQGGLARRNFPQRGPHLGGQNLRLAQGPTPRRALTRFGGPERSSLSSRAFEPASMSGLEVCESPQHREPRTLPVPTWIWAFRSPRGSQSSRSRHTRAFAQSVAVSPPRDQASGESSSHGAFTISSHS